MIITEYLIALGAGWPAEQARGLGFATLLASQPVLLLSTRTPDRPLCASGRRWTATLTAVIVSSSSRRRRRSTSPRSPTCCTWRASRSGVD
jgi:hypothetical protein